MVQYTESREGNAETFSYLQALLKSLGIKEEVLAELLRLTKHQEALLSEDRLNMESFADLMDAKEIQINKLAVLDEGFEKVYGKLRLDIAKNKGLYRDQIIPIQELIGRTTSLGVKLEALELRNKNSLEFHLTAMKKDIKSYKVNSATAAKYYKNSANQYQGESIFLDKKK